MKEEIHIGKEIKVVSNRLRRRLDQSIVKIDGVTSTQGLMLQYIYDHSKDGYVFQKDIEKEFNIRSSTMTGTLNLLESNGLIQRVPLEKDARLKRILLTEKALEIRKRIKKSILEVEHIIDNSITKEEREIFLSILGKISDCL
ncbi:MAG TPA: MarR family transcriptional regulator [Lachnospiraceae bacterium]|nr:MarR family transcriptional regulator [Lachnospiraceae bacterium]